MTKKHRMSQKNITTLQKLVLQVNVATHRQKLLHCCVCYHSMTHFTEVKGKENGVHLLIVELFSVWLNYSGTPV